MRRLQRLRSSASPLCSAAPSSTLSSSLASSTCRLHRELHATSKRTLVSRVSTSNDKAWLLMSRRTFSSSHLRRKEDKNSPLQLAELDELHDLEDPHEAAIETDLVIPKNFTRAPAASEVTDPNYTPAQSGEELEEVGGWGDFWDKPNAWPESKSYFGFKPFEKVTDPALLELITRRALIEALAVRQVVGQEALAESWRIGGSAENDGSYISNITSAKVQIAEDGTAQVVGAVEEIVEGVVGEEDSFPEVYPPVEDLKTIVQSTETEWRGVNLADPWLRFAVFKRVQQLSGHVIPDAKQLSIYSANDLLARLLAPSKSKKVAQELERTGELKELPNVSVYNRRVTPIDKEKMVGRWKVITKELQARGLPVIGTGGQGKTVEHKWATGRA